MDPRLRHVLDNILSTGRLQDLATEAGLSPQRIRALISTTLGVPPVRLRHWARLTRAIEVLDQGLTAAALHGGFADQPHFTRIARRLLGSPPGAVF
ncbi:helix-turn-helix domain-containing protein [Streptomyces smaragdinus]|nr:helix-turn-helix domain-containing protein [Streptomyces smaragdinus]